MRASRSRIPLAPPPRTNAARAISARILVVGSANVDVVANVERLPRAGETILASRVSRYLGGKGANQALAAARLGARVAFAGCVGHDPDGELVRSALTGGGVDVESLVLCGEATGMATIAVDARGENTIVLASGANACCNEAVVDRAFAEDAPAVLVVQNEIPAPTVAYAIARAHRRGAVTILNPAPARALEADVLRCVDYLTPNAAEAAALTGRAVTDESGAEEAAAFLVERGARNVIVTRGARGAHYAGVEGTRSVAAFSVRAVDTTGAGDAYTGALAAALAEDVALEHALVFASAAAALAVTRAGAQPSLPVRADVERFIAANLRDSA